MASRLIADTVARLYGENIPIHCRGRLIDLGCGNVPLYAAYREYVTDNVCVDWPNTFHHNAYLDYECDLTQRLPFGNDEFDTIILSDVMEHLPVPELLWSEMHRILTAGGKCLLNVPFYYWLHEEPHDYYRYTEHALRRFAGNAGFTVISLECVGGAPEVVADVLAKTLPRLPLLGRSLTIAIQATIGWLVSTRWGRRVSSETGRQMPLGYFMVIQKPDSSATST